MLEFVNGILARFATQDLRREEGQALVEYALILTLVSVVSITALALLGGKITDILGEVTDAL